MDAAEGDHLTRGPDVEGAMNLALASVDSLLYKWQRIMKSSLNPAPDSNASWHVVEALYCRL